VPPFTIRTGGKFRRNLLILLGVLAAGSVVGVRALGRFMSPEDPLVAADAIFVLAGTRIERPMEAADLYLEGYAPRILMTRDTGEQAIAIAERRGVHVPSDFDLGRDAVVRLGVPEDALVMPARVHDNTAQEAETLRDVARQRGWHRVIVVSSTYHLRRVALACRRALRGSGVEIIVRGSRYDPAVPDQWWRRRSDIRWIASEVPRLVLYALGVAG
jgi:uncharacterized SAM-binding protein YcdF (DUF218 family)